jgi:VIT1/CCC1 family predicted Fe2+/Mn2+ transporter
VADASLARSRRILDPTSRIAEALFGLIMVLTFTGSLSVVEAGRDDVRAMLIGALGCNIAWGIIDGILYLMASLSEQGTGIRALRALRQAPSAVEGQRVIAGALPPLVGEALGPAELEPIRARLMQLPEPPARPQLGKRDWLGALGVFFWVFTMTLPVALPFLFMGNLRQAMRVSNGIAIALLFVAGYAFGRVAEHRPWLTGLAMVVLGVILTALTIALGG